MTVAAWSCCIGGPRAERAVFIASAGATIEAPGLGASVTGPIATPVRNRREALHEASHAAVAVAVGDIVLSVQLEPELLCRHASRSGRIGMMLVTLAGDAAAEWAAGGRVERTHSEEAQAYLTSIRAGRGGPCDRCRAFRALCADAACSDYEVMSEYRCLENLSGAVVRHPDVWAAINEIAGALMEHGALSGEYVHEICARHFDAGFVLGNVE